MDRLLWLLTMRELIRGTMNTPFGRTVLLATLLLPGVYAQSDTGRIAGTITDATNAALQNATVTVKNEKTGQIRKVKANEQGAYIVTQLGPSSYAITAEATGMAPAEHTGIILQVGQERTLNIAMQVS